MLLHASPSRAVPIFADLDASIVQSATGSGSRIVHVQYKWYASDVAIVNRMHTQGRCAVKVAKCMS